MYRSRKTTKAYNPNKQRKLNQEAGTTCPFCRVDDRPVLTEGIHMQVVHAKFPYEFWDMHNVVEHLLLIPKRHVESLSELTDGEQLEAMHLMAEYEAAGYSVYWRSKTNGERTVTHQHTHLIKVNKISPRLSIYSKKPYIAFKV